MSGTSGAAPPLRWACNKTQTRINLAGPGRDEVVYIGALPDALSTTFGDIREWQTLGAHCAKYEREGWLPRRDLQKKWEQGPTLALGRSVSDVGLAEARRETSGS